MIFDLTITHNELIIRHTDGVLTAYFAVPADQIDRLVTTITRAEEGGTYTWHATVGEAGWRLWFGHGNAFLRLDHYQALDLARDVLALRKSKENDNE